MMFYGEEEDLKTTCECGIPAAKKVSSKPGPNCGREFFTCSIRAANPMNKDEGCSFFQAADGQPWGGSRQPTRQFTKRAVATVMPRTPTAAAPAPRPSPGPRVPAPAPACDEEVGFSSPPPPKMARPSPVIDDLVAVLANAASATSLVTAKLETLLTRAEQLFRKASQTMADGGGETGDEDSDEGGKGEATVKMATETVAPTPKAGPGAK